MLYTKHPELLWVTEETIDSTFTKIQHDYIDNET